MIATLLVAATCSISIPPVTALPGGGVTTGHVTATCNRAWPYSMNRIEYRADYTYRWKILGTERHPGGAAGELVTESVDSEPDYHGAGYWREVVVVHGPSDAWSVRKVGPVSWLKA